MAAQRFSEKIMMFADVMQKSDDNAGSCLRAGFPRCFPRRRNLIWIGNKFGRTAGADATRCVSPAVKFLAIPPRKRHKEKWKRICTMERAIMESATFEMAVTIIGISSCAVMGIFIFFLIKK
jgi:hypothetical protein